MAQFIQWFKDLTLDDVAKVGGKNASLGEMVRNLGSQGIRVPDGFAVTAAGYWHYLNQNNFAPRIKELMASLSNADDMNSVQRVGSQVREFILSGSIPGGLAQEIGGAYQELSSRYRQEGCDVAVRSSATAEDLPNASFAGQQSTFLNINGNQDLLDAYKKCLASLFTDRAIVYRMVHGFEHMKVGLSVGVQKMIRSDLASSGVAFSLETETGFKDVVMIEASYGLGESIVQGLVTPDEFLVHKPMLQAGYAPIIKKSLGDKKTKIIYGAGGTVKQIAVPSADQQQFALSEQHILSLARNVLTIEQYYCARAGRWVPMDIEWAIDGGDGNMYIIQARPETVHSMKKHTTVMRSYVVHGGQDPQVLVVGNSVGRSIASGVARVVASAADISQVQQGDIIVTDMTDPDWVPAMKRAAGIITNRGGRTCHAAIVSRELGIPAIVGAANATAVIKSGAQITIDCSQSDAGRVYAGNVAFDVQEIALDAIADVGTKIMVNLADPESAFATALLPSQGVGLTRLEFIISNVIKVHPLALVHPDKVVDAKVSEQIANLAAPYADLKTFFVDSLAAGIAHIAAAFYPRPVIVRLSDFKSNEYRNLIGGVYFEPEEENPMIGFRGASRYVHERYQEAFALECAALKKVREEMGLANVKVMVPFVRTCNEAKRVIEALAKHGLVRGTNGLELVMMCEIPSNVLLIDAFSELFDGFSIGSNDLTQLTLGVDRDSQILASLFDERDPAVQKMLVMAIEGAHAANRHIGICGQAPSDYPEIAEFLIAQGIDSISLNPDSVVPFLIRSR